MSFAVSTLFQVIFVCVWLVIFVAALVTMERKRARNRRVATSLGSTPPLMSIMVEVRYWNWGNGYIPVRGVGGSFVELSIWPGAVRLGLPKSRFVWRLGLGAEWYLPTSSLVVSNFDSRGFEGWLHLEGHPEGKRETFAVTAGHTRFALITALSVAGAQLHLGP